MGFARPSPTPLWTCLVVPVQHHRQGLESNVVRLERNLHEWRAAFNFVRNANGLLFLFFDLPLRHA
jgi:hypothetical protein